MADDISNKVLLDHLQAMKMELKGDIAKLDHRVNGLSGNISALEQTMTHGFEEARQHRQALQEDLEATMRVQMKQGKKIAQLSV